MKISTIALGALSLSVAVNSFNLAPLGHATSQTSSSALYGKLWDKLGIDPDGMDVEPGWYVMNCVAGSEKDLLAQAKHVTKGFSTDLIEKIVVPTERKLRSHGKSQKVVEVKVRYPGYCFVKMRCCAETYEPLQELPLCRSWMAGTVNQKGYKKLPPAPICLSDDEVDKFKGLEAETDEMYKKYGEDYTGRGDRGEDLLAQYEGYEVDNMVKILTGNFKGEDGVVKRLKDGQIMVRLFTYGNINDQWFDTNQIRPMTDAEAMKGLGGPAAPVGQDDFDVSIGKKPRSRENSRGDLYKNATGGAGGRNRRQDRIARGEGGDIFGRSEQQIQQEEQNWRQFREEQRAEQQQRRGDQWGIKERSSWDSGDDAATMDADGNWKSGREMRRERNKREAQIVSDALEGDGDWDLFGSDTQDSATSGEEDDFFNSLMSELSDNLEEKNEPSGGSKKNKDDEKDDEDDFFSSLMSELSDEGESDSASTSKISKETSFDDDDFFANLEADLSESLSDGNDGADQSNDDDDFFASLEADISTSLDSDDSNDKNNDDFFSALENDSKELSEEEVPTTKPQAPVSQDYSSLKVAELKDLLKARGLKVSGKKIELIERLQQS